MEMQASNENESYNIARGLPTQTKSPAVRLHIKIDAKPAAQEVIRKVTQAHEVVEVDGFVFKRKRVVPKQSASPQLPSLSAEKRSRTPAAENLASPLATVTPQPAPLEQASQQAGEPATGEAADASAIRTPTAQNIAAATTALLEQVPTDMAEPDRLASLCELLCAAELDELHQQDAEARVDPVVAAAVQNALGAFVRSVQSAAANGSLQEQTGAAAPTEQSAEKQGDDDIFSVDLQARKAGLRAQLAAFSKEEEEWQEVLAQQGAWQQAPATHTLALPPQANSSPSDAQQLDERAESGVMGLVTAETSQAGAADAAPVGPQGSSTLALVPASADHTDTTELAIETSRSLLSSQAGVLRQAEADAHRKVAMQVEGLCAMVSGVEELVARAERHCNALQAKYHQQRFRAYPHVDSPAKLIQELLKPGGAVPDLDV